MSHYAEQYPDAVISKIGFVLGGTDAATGTLRTFGFGCSAFVFGAPVRPSIGSGCTGTVPTLQVSPGRKHGWAYGSSTPPGGSYILEDDHWRGYLTGRGQLGSMGASRPMTMPLAALGNPTLEEESRYGLALTVQIDVDGDGVSDGKLFQEPALYGPATFWSAEPLGVPSGRGHTSFGTLPQFRAANPQAVVTEIAFVVGPGVHIRGTEQVIVRSLTAGCTRYHFIRGSSVVALEALAPRAVGKGTKVAVKVTSPSGALNLVGVVRIFTLPWGSSASTPVAANGNGTVNLGNLPAGDHTLEARFAGNYTLPFSVSTQSVRVYFTDYGPGSQFFEETQWAATRGIPQGRWKAGEPVGSKFGPFTTMTRAEAATWLDRFDSNGGDSSLCYEEFTDVPAGHPNCGSISQMRMQGVVRGFPDGSFRPNEPIQRQAMAAWLYRAVEGTHPAPKCTSAPFTDVPKTATFCGEIAWLKRSGITTGWGTGGQFKPGEIISRDATVAWLSRVPR